MRTEKSFGKDKKRIGTERAKRVRLDSARPRAAVVHHKEEPEQFNSNLQPGDSARFASRKNFV